MVLLITLTHRSYHAVDERDLILCDAVLLVEHPVGPFPVHRQVGHEREPFAVEVLRVLTQRDQEANETGPQVAAKKLRSLLGVEAVDHKIGFSTRRAWFKNGRLGCNPVRKRAALAI